ncbi:hypothetical protein D3C86_1166760 [compost metagenome]
MREQVIGRQKVGAVVVKQAVADGGNARWACGLERGREPALQRHRRRRAHVLRGRRLQAGHYGSDFFGRALEHRAQQHQSGHPLGPRGGIGARDQAAHRIAQHVRFAPAGRVQLGVQLRNEPRHLRGPLKARRRAMAQQVVAQHVKASFQQRRHIIPKRVVQAHAVQQHQRRATAGSTAWRAHFDCASCANSCKSE